MGLAGENDDPETSSAAIVEGMEVVTEACDDACSICLEEFSYNDPSMVTNCKHQFHLHCILEWCHRSANCPMCWQPIRLNDTTSQNLLEDIERERNLKAYKSRNSPAAFYHPTLTNYDLHLPTGGGEIDLEEHIFQHLAAAVSMQSGHHVSLREGQQLGLSSSQHPFLIVSAATNPHGTSTSISLNRNGSESHSNASTVIPSTLEAQVQVSQSPPQSARRLGSYITSANQPRILFESRNFGGQSSQDSDNLAESSYMQSSESIRSRLNAWSMRYRESISRNTRGWKERLFARNSSIAVLSSEVQREMNSRICCLSRIMERLESRMNNGYGHSSEPSHAGRHTRNGTSNER